MPPLLAISGSNAKVYWGAPFFPNQGKTARRG